MWRLVRNSRQWRILKTHDNEGRIEDGERMGSKNNRMD